jgi:hypothetical protein
MISQLFKWLCGVMFLSGVALRSQSAEAETNSLFTAAMESITTEELYEHVEVLADDVYEGREAGSRGGHAAAKYLVKQLRPFELTPAGEGGDYVQSFGNDWRNILALKQGDDPQLRHEMIVVGAHYDHVGYGNRRNSPGTIGKIHNGADDNASGIAVLLETIEAFAASGLNTRRSILFAFWDGEERGLVGSRHWLNQPTLPADRVKLALTIDMVGRLRDGQLYVLGTRSGYGLRRMLSGPLPLPLSESGRGEPLWLDFSWELHENSDHWSFLERRVPIALLHTGLHQDYHRPSDDVEKINRDGMRDISRYLLFALMKLANEDRLPAFRRQVTRETRSMQRSLEQPLVETSLENWPPNTPPPRVGISWREDEAEPGAVFLTRVVDGTPAADAGLAVHDRVYEVNDQPFADAAAFQSTVLSLLDAGQPEFTLLIERRGHLRTVAVRARSEEQGAGSKSQGP